MTGPCALNPLMSPYTKGSGEPWRGMRNAAGAFTILVGLAAHLS